MDIFKNNTKILENLETSRKRIIQFIENQNIKPSEFLIKTGLKKGFIDKSHQASGASDIFLAKILECYPKLSAEWLLTGKGKMLKNNEGIIEATAFDNILESNDVTFLKIYIKNLLVTIELLKEKAYPDGLDIDYNKNLDLSSTLKKMLPEGAGS